MTVCIYTLLRIWHSSVYMLDCVNFTVLYVSLPDNIFYLISNKL